MDFRVNFKHETSKLCAQKVNVKKIYTAVKTLDVDITGRKLTTKLKVLVRFIKCPNNPQCTILGGSGAPVEHSRVDQSDDNIVETL